LLLLGQLPRHFGVPPVFRELGTDLTLNVPVSSGSTQWIVIRIAEDIPQGQEVEQGLEQGWAALGHVT
jgi:hypothetical protein